FAFNRAAAAINIAFGNNVTIENNSFGCLPSGCLPGDAGGGINLSTGSASHIQRPIIRSNVFNTDTHAIYSATAQPNNALIEENDIKSRTIGIEIAANGGLRGL